MTSLYNGSPFSSYLTAQRRGGCSRRPKAVLILSALLHMLVLVGLAARSFLEVEDLSPPRVSIALTFPHTPPAPSQVAPAQRQGRRPPHMRRRPRLDSPRYREEVAEPQEDAPEEIVRNEDEDLPGPIGDVIALTTGATVGEPLGQGLTPVATTPPVATAPPETVAASVLAKHCLVCPPPSLPMAYRRPGSTLSLRARLCLNDRGTIASVEILEGIAKDADAAIINVVRGWRYRPYVGEQGPTAVCTRMRFQFVGR